MTIHEDVDLDEMGRVLDPDHGRPRTIQTVEEFEAAAEAYFKQCKKKKELPTFGGLDLAVGFKRVGESARYARQWPNEFRDAYGFCELTILAAWEGALAKPKFQATNVRFHLSHRFNEQYATTVQHRHSGPDGEPIDAGVSAVASRLVDAVLKAGADNESGEDSIPPQ